MPAAVAVPAIVGGVSSLVGGGIAAHSAHSASKAQQDASARALALQQGVYDEQRRMLSPYVQGGQSAFARLMDGYWNNKPYGMMAPPGGPQGQPMPMPPQGAPPQGSPAGPPPSGGFFGAALPQYGPARQGY